MSILSQKSLHEKLELMEQIKAKVREEIQVLLKSAVAAKDGATHGDAVAKSKYDTHGLELSYLAGSQFQRAKQLENDLGSFSKQAISILPRDNAITVTALVALRDSRNLEKLFYISNSCAGIRTNWLEHEVQVISPESPLGVELIDCYVGDKISLGPNPSQQYEIIDLI